MAHDGHHLLAPVALHSIQDCQTAAVPLSPPLQPNVRSRNMPIVGTSTHPVDRTSTYLKSLRPMFPACVGLASYWSVDVKCILYCLFVVEGKVVGELN